LFTNFKIKKHFLLVISFLQIILAKEVLPIEILLTGEATERSLEMSGLAWYNNYLILMPQYVNESKPRFYYLKKSTINDWLNGNKEKPLNPSKIDIIMPDYFNSIKGYQGFEAICFIGNKAYLIIETKNNDSMQSFIVKGSMDIKNKTLIIDPEKKVEILLPVNIKNMGYESILKYKYRLMVLFEANGINVNSDPKASFYNSSLKQKGHISFPNIEYRITDATELDDQGRFWAINFFWPGEKKRLNPGKDLVLNNTVKGETHQEFEHVERLVEFKIDGKNIYKTNSLPIQLKLNQNSRNWEGVVRMENKGFLMIVDEHPRTILAFIKKP
tara:strand:+ start:713 stop:1699 length:987 start_codon:yes stop_codon:yes gene_type:complete